MAPGGVVSLNPFNPLCTTNLCLQQVVGSIDNNPGAQGLACAAEFGLPSYTTV